MPILRGTPSLGQIALGPNVRGRLLPERKEAPWLVRKARPLEIAELGEQSEERPRRVASQLPLQSRSWCPSPPSAALAPRRAPHRVRPPRTPLAVPIQVPVPSVRRLQEVKTQLCGELSDLDADLTEVSTSGTEAGQDVLDRIGSFATTFETGAASLTAVGADDAAAAAEELAANLESLSTSGGEDARALAGDGAERAQELSDAMQCP